MRILSIQRHFPLGKTKFQRLKHQKRALKYKLPYETWYFVIVTLLVFFFFQLSLIFTCITFKGYCFYEIWLASSWPLSPFWSFVLVTFLCFLWLFTFSRSLLKPVSRVGTIFFVVSVLFYLLWFRAYFGLWNSFEFEKGNISAEAYFGDSYENAVNYTRLDGRGAVVKPGCTVIQRDRFARITKMPPLDSAKVK